MGNRPPKVDVVTEKQQSVTTESVTTVIIAGGANLAIAVAKVIAGVISGSASMLSEAAHSFADTTTEGVALYSAAPRH